MKRRIAGISLMPGALALLGLTGCILPEEATHEMTATLRSRGSTLTLRTSNGQIEIHGIL